MFVVVSFLLLKEELLWFGYSPIFFSSILWLAAQFPVLCSRSVWGPFVAVSFIA